MSRAWVREPLVHFLLAGAAIFLITGWWQVDGGDARTINVGRQQLQEYMLARAQLADPGQFDAVFAGLPPEHRQALVRRVALDEALYREGLALGLDRVDPLVRQRIIQQTRELLGDEAAADVQLSDAELEAWYTAHRDDYREAETLGFAHVFFGDGDDARRALQRATSELAWLRSANPPVEEAIRRGERFLYETRLQGATRAEVAAKFGSGFAAAVSEAAVDQWHGPIRSEHGWHLVRVSERVAGGLPTPQELGDRLRADALDALREQAATRALERMLQDYRVVTAPDLPP